MPRFVHDCPSCTYLGSDEQTGSDLYFCTQGGIAPTVIARFSDRDADYTSGLPLAHLDWRLAEAKRRAQERGLIP